jgi:hypothetical protein
MVFWQGCGLVMGRPWCYRVVAEAREVVGKIGCVVVMVIGNGGCY